MKKLTHSKITKNIGILAGIIAIVSGSIYTYDYFFPPQSKAEVTFFTIDSRNKTPSDSPKFKNTNENVPVIKEKSAEGKSLFQNTHLNIEGDIDQETGNIEAKSPLTVFENENVMSGSIKQKTGNISIGN